MGIRNADEFHYNLFEQFQLMLVKQRDKLENVMRNFLVEDRGMNGSTGYVEFLCHIHKEIRNVSS